MVTPAWPACPGCGVRLPSADASPDARYNASAACQQLYDELSSDTLLRG